MKKLYFLLGLSLVWNTQAQNLQVNIDQSGLVCSPGDCVELFANYTNLSETTSYSVGSIPYSPQFPFTGGMVLDNTADDVWSPTVNLPFNFNFYGAFYNQLKVGSNGVVTFDSTQLSGLQGACLWNFTTPIPNTNFPIKNAIFGVYQDTDIRTEAMDNDAVADNLQNVNYYISDTGINAAPNRAFIINFNMLPQFQCEGSVGLQTSQIVLHEGSNVIEVFVHNRTSCATWNAGVGVIGLQNSTGSQAIAPPGRNTGTWNATNEAWRFTPSGTAIAATVSWTQAGTPVGSGNPITVCPTGSASYLATVTYQTATPFSISNEIALIPAENYLTAPDDIVLCTNDTPPYQFDLGQFNATLLGAVPNTNDYMILYYNNLQDAEIQSPTGTIPSSSPYSVMDDTTIYIGVDNIVTGCYSVFPANIIINPVPDAPSGDATQTFTPGQTLANLVVSGQNIQWYDHPTQGNLLPDSTVLVNGTTYYASQNVGGCESRILANRLAVTVTATLGNQQFSQSDIRLYPNPASHSLKVSYPTNVDQIEIYNLLGQMFLQQQQNKNDFTVDVSNLKSGHYMIRLQAGNEIVTTKFIKK
ncbi:T9SS type A sorting domain-containing protein [Flavobacterium sp.]|uniref:T9SS type A sorting domain-containing protein n=1 Tax=Flavobacterium sp. TaxID=239 RepID=UPI0039E359D5